jgi:signal transduction histidine kinase
MNILVAEDNLFYARLLGGTLAEWGYEVVAVQDGEAAWQVLRDKDAPKLAILDWMMPGLDGVELCRRLRATAREEPTYVILLTAKEGRENVVAGLQSGADDYICKPFDRDELRARLQVGLRIVGLQASLAARVRDLEYALSGAQKLEVIGRLAGGVAHDFNNLLTVIIGGTDVLLAAPRLGESQREFLRMVRGAGERGATLTRQLLAFSRKQVLVPEVVWLNALVRDVEKLLRSLIGEDIELVTRLDTELACVEADRGQLEQVLMNLAVNSRDAMPRGGTFTIETHNVEVGSAEGRRQGAEGRRQPSLPAFCFLPSASCALPPGSYVLLVVSDTGCGMDEHVRAHLFEPFFTTKEPGKGTGLGLATVYGIVHQSRGFIEVASAPRCGTTFRIFLPQTGRPGKGDGVTGRRGDGVKVPFTSSPRHPVAPSSEGGRETVLLVEDEDGVRDMARHVLQANRYAVLEARDGEEALGVSAAWREPIHLLVTDLVMPRTGGLELAEQLAPRRPGMKVLFMSGYTGDALAHQTITQSGKPFLQKPFTPGALAAKVREVLDSARCP